MVHCDKVLLSFVVLNLTEGRSLQQLGEECMVRRLHEMFLKGMWFALTLGLRRRGRRVIFVGHCDEEVS